MSISVFRWCKVLCVTQQYVLCVLLPYSTYCLYSFKLSISPCRPELHNHTRDFYLSTDGRSRSWQNCPCIGFLLCSSLFSFSMLDLVNSCYFGQQFLMLYIYALLDELFFVESIWVSQHHILPLIW